MRGHIRWSGVLGVPSEPPKSNSLSSLVAKMCLTRCGLPACCAPANGGSRAEHECELIVNRSSSVPKPPSKEVRNGCLLGHWPHLATHDKSQAGKNQTNQPTLPSCLSTLGGLEPPIPIYNNHSPEGCTFVEMMPYPLGHRVMPSAKIARPVRNQMY